jgi:predicted  nucleic acid-binding Zn-ribbon protein
MDDFQLALFAFFAIAEAALVLLVVAAALFLRSRTLAGRVQALRQQLKKAQELPEPVGYDQYLRDAIIRNEALLEQAVAAQDDAERKAAELLRLRRQFLELELAAHDVDKNPVQFQDTLTVGLSELIEQLRPAAPTVAEPVAAEPSVEASVAPQTVAKNADAGRATRDTHDEEFDRLKQIINNQQDAMAALRAELKAREADVQDLDRVLSKLDEYEQHESELQQCLKVLTQENQRLKAARTAGGETSPRTGEAGVAVAATEVSADRDAAGSGERTGGLYIEEEKHQLESTVQELQALVEFKDAAIEELEKQYNALESKYLALSGEK